MGRARDVFRSCYTDRHDQAVANDFLEFNPPSANEINTLNELIDAYCGIFGIDPNIEITAVKAIVQEVGEGQMNLIFKDIGPELDWVESFFDVPAGVEVEAGDEFTLNIIHPRGSVEVTAYDLVANSRKSLAEMLREQDLLEARREGEGEEEYKERMFRRMEGIFEQREDSKTTAVGASEVAARSPETHALP